MQSLNLLRPDDWHLHLRDGRYLNDTVPASSRHFERALVMPNLEPPLSNIPDILAYRARIKALASADFTPYFTLYLNSSLTVETLEKAALSDCILGAKLYPQGATTNSDAGVATIRSIYPLLETMQSLDLVLQIHGEVTRGDIFMRENIFIKKTLGPLVRDFPKLRMVLEHISSKAAVEFVTSASDKVAATITPHHLFYNRNDMLAGRIRPHYYCLPILKSAANQNALLKAAISQNPKFFAGTDSAPHALGQKECKEGCAGIYSAPFALAIYAEVFDKLEALEKLEPFMSHFGADFYQLPRNTRRITLNKSAQCIPETLPFADTWVAPIGAGDTLNWSVIDE